MTNAKHQSAPETPCEASLVAEALAMLSQHAHFRGRLHHLSLEMEGDALIVTGAVPSFYLKQLLQAALRGLRGGTRVLNNVEVVSAHGISSCSQRRRELCALEYAWFGKVPTCVATCEFAPTTPHGPGLPPAAETPDRRAASTQPREP
jgi:hypothetical protein